MTNNQTRYFWTDGSGVLVRHEMGGGKVDPFFESVEKAEEFLELKQDMGGDKTNLQSLVLREANGTKVKEATEVLTEQVGFESFMAGG